MIATLGSLLALGAKALHHPIRIIESAEAA